MNYRNRTINIISLFVAIASILIPSIFFVISAPETIKLQSIIIFGIIVVVVIVASISYILYQGYRKMFKDIQDNKKEIFEMKKSLNFKSLFDSMDVRLRVIEKLLDKKNKRAQIDPRIIWILLLLLLLYLFLKSVGVLP